MNYWKTHVGHPLDPTNALQLVKEKRDILAGKIKAGVTMTKLFEAVKAKVGPISTKVFMSDDAPAYINA